MLSDPPLHRRHGHLAAQTFSVAKALGLEHLKHSRVGTLLGQVLFPFAPFDDILDWKGLEKIFLLSTWNSPE